ncbi:hypothetical protein U9M48_020705 [Paspalum notatum var. saurae]|uniref:Remorin C-terminal domain-containing protein n=1 Tax=Paspalum notatum var. saurae TaxID=547442 RepID=A0AAQ3WSB7_PASNO
MRALDDKECYSYTVTTNGGRAHRKQSNPVPPASSSRPKPTPSKWDDAQKWLVGGGGGGAKPRHSNADDRRLLGSASQNGRVSCSSADGALEYAMVLSAPPTPPLQLGLLGGGDDVRDVGETTKNMTDCVVAQHGSPAAAVVRPVCLRDMGTEMTPIASKEPSRTATPLRASTPVGSRSSTPVRRRQEAAGPWEPPPPPPAAAARGGCAAHGHGQDQERAVPLDDDGRVAAAPGAASSLESRAAAWDEAERAKFTARYKREEVKIQAWENQEKRKAEMEMKKIQMKADQMKARAQEKLANRLAATRRVAEEKRAGAEAKLSERAARTTEKANYIRRTGHLPSSFSFFKMPSFCG